MSRFYDWVTRGLRSAQPAAAASNKGMVYYVSDESKLERSSGSAWEAFAPSGVVLIEQHTASGSSELVFTSCFSSLYDDYEFRFTGIRLSTDAASLLVRFSTNGGVSYDSSAIYDNTFGYSASGNTSAAGGGANQTEGTIAGGIDNTATSSMSGKVQVADPLSASLYKELLGEVAYTHDTLGNLHYRTSSRYRNAAAVNAVRFYPSAGTITVGSIRCYAYVK